MKKIITVLLLTGLIIVNSCERFVDEPENATSVTLEHIFRDANSINLFFNGIYSTLLSGGPGSGFLGERVSARNYASLLNGYNALGFDVVRYRPEWFIHYHNRNHYFPLGAIVHFYWHFSYFTIEQVNTILAQLDKSAHLTEEGIAPHYAEAYALRAHFHHILATNYALPYGHLNRSENLAPPISTSVINLDEDKEDEEDAEGGLSTVSSIYAQIVADFERSLSYYETIPEHARAAKTRINEAVTKGLYARALLDMGDYSAAALMFEGAIEAHTEEPPINYTPDNDEYSVVPTDDGNPSVPLGEGAFTDIDTPSWMWGIISDREQSAFRDGFNRFWGGERGYDGYRPFTLSEPFVETFTDTDVRRAQFVTSRDPASGAPVYYTLKFGQESLFTEDNVLMRVEEMLLGAAESHARSGNEAMAITYLDIIRLTRDPPPPPDPDNPAPPPPPPLTGEELIDAILLERRKELYGEGVADYPDRRRLGQDWERSDYHGRITTRSTQFCYRGFDDCYVFPFPQFEIDRNDKIRGEQQHPICRTKLAENGCEPQ